MDSIGTVWDRNQLQIIMRTSIQFLIKPWPCPLDLEEKTVTRAARAVCQRKKPPRDRKTKRVSQWGGRDLEVCWQVLVSAERILWETKGFFCVCARNGRKQEITLYPRGSKCIIDDSKNNRASILGSILDGLRKKIIRNCNQKVEIKYFRRDGKWKYIWQLYFVF